MGGSKPAEIGVVMDVSEKIFTSVTLLQSVDHNSSSR